MKLLNKLFVVSSIAVISACSTSFVKAPDHNRQNYLNTENFYLNAINKSPENLAALNLFFTQMPKGGDIHHHYSGSIYVETYLDWVEKKGWLIDKCTLRIVTQKEKKGTAVCPLLKVQDLINDSQSYGKLLSLWSDKDYSNHDHYQAAPDTNFFNTFGYFGAVSDEYMDEGLSIIKERAIKENVSYIETMLTKVGTESSNYYKTQEIEKLNMELRNSRTQEKVDAILNKIISALDKNTKFSGEIDSFLERVKKNSKDIDDEHFTMRFQTYAARTQDPTQVFFDLYSGYIASKRSSLIVGVNIVAAENNHIALSDYSLHMQMFNYLSNKFPDVHNSLHAGELTLGMVRPKDLSFHINEAVNIANAKRIGHGVDIPYEAQPDALLENLKNRDIAIEINLTSNQFILGVEKGSHPYQIYSAYGVPLVISTDDSGVSRNNLSSEYMLLASRYKPSYSKIKSYVYNSIYYSFLSQEEKKKQLAILELQFLEFETKISDLMIKMN